MLQRGFINAVIQDISFNNDSNFIVISSSRGTSHLFEIDPEREGNSLIPLSATNMIRSGNSSGWVGTMSGTGNSWRLYSKCNCISLCYFNNQNNSNHSGSASDNSSKRNLMIFASSGCMTQYAFKANPVGAGHEITMMKGFHFESGLETEGQIVVEPIRRWFMIQNQSRREMKDHQSDYMEVEQLQILRGKYFLRLLERRVLRTVGK